MNKKTTDRIQSTSVELVDEAKRRTAETWKDQEKLNGLVADLHKAVDAVKDDPYGIRRATQLNKGTELTKVLEQFIALRRGKLTQAEQAAVRGDSVTAAVALAEDDALSAETNEHFAALVSRVDTLEPKVETLEAGFKTLSEQQLNERLIHIEDYLEALDDTVPGAQPFVPLRDTQPSVSTSAPASTAVLTTPISTAPAAEPVANEQPKPAEEAQPSPQGKAPNIARVATDTVKRAGRSLLGMQQSQPA
jgi:hypothetical protein